MDATKYAGNESAYLKAADLDGKRPQVVVDGVEEVEFEDDGSKKVRLALTIRGKDKKISLNPTNTKEMIAAFGGDTESWVGKTIQLGTKSYDTFPDGLTVTGIDTSGLDDSLPF